MANDRTYIRGIISFEKNAKAPDFVLGNGVINIDDLTDWIATEGKEHITDYKGKRQIKIQFLMSKDNRVSIIVDTYKKDDGQF
jgi:hypothetical protein